MAIRFDQEHPYAIPSFPLCKLTAPAATALGLDYNQMPILSPHADKRSYVFHDDFQETPLHLRKIDVLAKGPHHEMMPLSNQAAFAELVRHTRAVNIMTAPEQITAHLQQCTCLFKTVPVCQFMWRPALEALPELVDLVKADLMPSSQAGVRSHTKSKPSCSSA
ncbi:hypothetical protein [Acaryochloris sp. IP29b_bin.148]|uniref:hypothetical protein n=1 Tax=Acaryochloris sp. IP29b_bin.148 TaxID=2969218 RepID=UPI00262C4A5B|nr:hypothetical protein [Acaryochloris sp. IP29b_bin.148]